MVPEVGGEAAEEVRASIDAMRAFTERIIQSGAETVVLISPACAAERALSSHIRTINFTALRKFHAPETEVEAPLDEEMLSAIALAASARSYEIAGVTATIWIMARPCRSIFCNVTAGAGVSSRSAILFFQAKTISLRLVHQGGCG